MDAFPVVHCDLALARRLEGAEGQANVDFVEARLGGQPQCGAAWTKIAGAFAVFDGVGSPCTQTFGLGLFQSVGATELTELERFFLSRGAAVAHEVSPLVGPLLPGRLQQRGYQPIELSNVLFRPLLPSRPGDPAGDRNLHVRVIHPGEEELWARTAALGWSDAAPELFEFLTALGQITAHRRNTHCFLVLQEETPLAAAALCVVDGVALFAGAATIPQWRKRGAQQALLEERLRFAARAGCDLAMFVAEPGSASQRNAERKGFRVAYTRTKWQLAGVEQVRPEFAGG